MTRTPLHEPSEEPMRIVGFMSGEGSNLHAIIHHEKRLERVYGRSAYNVVAIFTDRESNAQSIGADYDVPVVYHDIKEFYDARDKPLGDLETRVEYDAEAVEALAPYEASAAAFAGYMRIVTAPIVDAYLGVNVHPADLSVRSEDGSRRYTGLNVVRAAIEDGASELRSTTHLIDRGVDTGRILMRSQPIQVTNESIECHEERLKRAEWMLYPRTIEYLANGRFTQDENGSLYLDDVAIPNGAQIE